MPLVLLLVIIDVMLVVHAVRTGRASPWAFIILFAPYIGAIAYVVAVLVPDCRKPAGPADAAAIAKALNPEKRYRELSDTVEIADTIANRAALAEECLALGRFEEAKRHFEVILARPMGDEPFYVVGRARAQFGLGQAADTVAILDDLREALSRLPVGGRASALCPRARNLRAQRGGAAGIPCAVRLFPRRGGARALWRAARAARAGEGEAKAWLTEVLTQLRRAPAHVRKAQAEWINLAEKVVRA